MSTTDEMDDGRGHEHAFEAVEASGRCIRVTGPYSVDERWLVEVGPWSLRQPELGPPRLGATSEEWGDDLPLTICRALLAAAARKEKGGA